MRDLKSRLNHLEDQSPPQGAPVYLFGNDKVDLDAKIHEASTRHPERPVIGFRWQDPDESRT